jgi:hypothetical protein
METTYTNLRVIEKRQYSDTYGTGDQIGYNVYQVVRDFDESDIYDKTYSRGRNVGQYFTADLLKAGCVIETVSTLEFAQYIVNGIVKKKIEQSKKEIAKIKRNGKTKN